MAVESVSCPACGAENVPASDRCTVCGEALDTRAPDVSQNSEWPAPWAPVRQPQAAAARPAAVRRPSGGRRATPPKARRSSEGSSRRAIGVVRDVKVRTEQRGRSERKTDQILSFRIDRFDEEGRRLQPIAVEMRGRSLMGVLNDGDSVDAGRVKHGVLHPRRVRNLSTDSIVKVRRGSAAGALGTVFSISVFVVIVLIGYALVHKSIFGHHAFLGHQIP